MAHISTYISKNIDTSLTRIGLPAVRERITLEPGRTAAHRHMVADLTFGTRAARARARTNAISVDARHVAATLGWVQALGPVAVAERIAAVAARTRADGSTAGAVAAQGIHTARVACATRLGWNWDDWGDAGEPRRRSI